MLENKEYYEVKRSKEKSFGFTMCIIFLLIALYPLLYNDQIRIWSFCISVIFLILSIFFSNSLKRPNILWFKLGLFLGKIFAPIVMFLIFFIVVTPTSYITRIFIKDLIKKKYDKNLSTYWVEKKEDLNSMDKQF